MKIKNPIISVIIPIYNTEKYLAECLDSVLNQTFQNFEIICINDASTDNSWAILKKYAKKDPRIKIVKHRKNTGCVSSKNEAIQMAMGEYIYPLDSDDKILPDTLRKLLTAMEMHLGDIISSEVMLFGEQSGKMELCEPNIYNFANCNCVVNASLFRKEDFMQLPNDGYDTNFSHGLEDYDLWLNFIFNLGKKIYRIPDVLYYYRIKSKEESRNLLHSEMHLNLLKYLQIKYPEINSYINQRILLAKAEQILQHQRAYKKKYIKLFEFIPLIKIKGKRNIKKIYLFGFIPILKIIKK